MPEFTSNLNPDEYLEWVKALDRIFEAKGHDDEKSFKIASLNSQGMLPYGLKMSRSNRLEMARGRLTHGRSLNLV